MIESILVFIGNEIKDDLHTLSHKFECLNIIEHTHEHTHEH